ncbi:MAG TPA: acetyl-CoA C-acetyltransferase [Candidatus Ozemobacteraceae bacterium]|nr:acetyl-CoA C-acetyltransferase [Candidatus Ozemobacteraceae bacterium]
MKKVAIASPVRTPIGSFGGALAPLSASEIGAKAIAAVLERSGVAADAIEEVYLGNVLQATNGQNPARQAAMKGGIPQQIPATTINTVCGSGLHAVGLAFNAIRAGQIELALAGGMESMSNAPYAMKGARNGLRLGHGEILDTMVLDGLTCPFNNYHMGITAENVAEEFNVSRQEQDEFSCQSQQKAAAARQAGRFADEIVPVIIKNKKGDITFKDDEFIRPDTSLEKLAGLRPAFKKDGTVTAGNASGINDGGAAMLVVSEEKCKALKLAPMAYIRGYSLVGLRPEIMGMGPVYAVRKLLEAQNLTVADIDLFELNEAFASQSIAVRKELGISPDKINVNGGAIALGHPIGASGARILISLLYEMKRGKKKLGIASLCIGTGMGIAMLVENANV